MSASDNEHSSKDGGTSLVWIAAMWGFVSAISLVIGSVIGTWRLPRKSIRAVLMSFGGGALLFALSVELFAHRLHEGSADVVWIMEAAAICGGVLFEGLNKILSASGGEFRKPATLQRRFRQMRALSLRRFVKRLSRLPIFASLTMEEIRHIVQNSMHRERFHKGDAIPTDTAMYFILSGCVEIILFDEDDAQLSNSPNIHSMADLGRDKIADKIVLGKDQLFGDVAVLTGSDVRTEVKALAPTRTLVMPAREFRHLIDRKPDVRKHLLLRAVEHLQQAHILSGLPLRVLIQLSTQAVPVTYKTGERLIEGRVDERTPLYIVFSGTVDVVRDDDGDRQIVRTNQVVGIEHLIYARPRPVTAVAVEEVTALKICRQDLDAAVRETEGGLPWLNNKQRDLSSVPKDSLTPPASECGSRPPTPSTCTCIAEDSKPDILNTSLITLAGAQEQTKANSSKEPLDLVLPNAVKSDASTTASSRHSPASPCINISKDPMYANAIKEESLKDCLTLEVSWAAVRSKEEGTEAYWGPQKSKEEGRKLSKQVLGWTDDPQDLDASEYKLPWGKASSLVSKESSPQKFSAILSQESRKISKRILGWTEQPSEQQVDMDPVEPFNPDDDEDENDIVTHQNTVQALSEMNRSSSKSPNKLLAVKPGAATAGANVNRQGSMQSVDSEGGGHITMEEAGHGSSKHAAIMIWLGILIDGVPEALVIGMMVTSSGGQVKAVLPFVIGVFLSNLPESMSSSGTMKQHGMKTKTILAMWWTITLTTAIGAGLGAAIFPTNASEDPQLVTLIVAVEGLAAGAMLTMIAQTMMPEAFEQGGDVVGLSCLLGFLTALSVKLLPL